MLNRLDLSSSNPEDTAALLIDFNRAEQLQDDAHSEAVVDRTVGSDRGFDIVYLIIVILGNTNLHCQGC